MNEYTFGFKANVYSFYMLTTCSLNSNAGVLHVRFGAKIGESTDHEDEWLNRKGANIHVQRGIQLVDRDESLRDVPGKHYVRGQLGKYRGRLFPYDMQNICDSYLKINEMFKMLKQYFWIKGNYK